MIGRLHGIILSKAPPEVLIDVQGVGYEVQVPMSTFCTLPAEGQTVTLMTHFVVREDAQLLYGFASAAEREIFRTLIKVSGIGPRIALAILSGLTVDQFSMAIFNGEVGLLTKIPGVGKKTAERLVLELKGKLNATQVALSQAPTQRQDVLSALIALGYSEKEALATLKELPAELSVNDAIRAALKILGR